MLFAVWGLFDRGGPGSYRPRPDVALPLAAEPERPPSEGRGPVSGGRELPAGIGAATLPVERERPGPGRAEPGGREPSPIDELHPFGDAPAPESLRDSARARADWSQEGAVHSTLHEGQRAFCFVRECAGDRMVLTTYGRSSGFCVDPIEKKPLDHFLPGTSVLSFGTAGCNLGCRFCQNWEISKNCEASTAPAGYSSASAPAESPPM